ncbi:hypothetical protein CsatA_006431 [Cannabis sativa]
MEELQCNPESTQLQLKYQLKEGGQPLQIKDDKSLLFYIKLLTKETDFTRYPLCVNKTSNTAPPNQTMTIRSVEDDTFFLETGTVSSESTIQQPENNREKTTAVDEDFDFTDYAKLVAAEMVQQLENNQEEEEEVDNTEMIIINDKRHETIEKGQIYKDKETLISTLCYFAIKKTFQYKVVKSCTKEYNIVCLDTNCKWSLKATKNGNTETFIIRSYQEEHTCAVTIRFGDQRQATSKLIADFMNYMKAWRSKERAQTQLHGNAKESYNLLPRYLYMLQKTNPGTLIDIEKEDDDSFKYAFVALNAAIKGWPNCKPIIVVDGTFLKAAYGGTLLTANTQDAESKIFPLAYCIVDSENDKSWEWYSTMTSNIAEALNSANLAARETPVTTLMECLRAQMQEWTYNNRKEAQKCTTRLTPSSKKKLIGNYV